jgi:hypothetical protein
MIEEFAREDPSPKINTRINQLHIMIEELAKEDPSPTINTWI